MFIRNALNSQQENRQNHGGVLKNKEN